MRSAKVIEKLRLASLGNTSHKGFKHSEATKAKISAVHKGKVSPMKGKTHSEAARRKLSLAGKHRKVSKETREKLSRAFTGRCFTPEWRARISLAKMGNKCGQYGKGKIVSEDTKQKLSAINKAKWASVSKEERTVLLADWIAAGQEAALKVKPSSIELMVREVLDALKVSYLTHQQIGRYRPDIVVPETKLIIECDGDYWHGHNDRQQFDKARDAWLESQGYKVIRLWECDIRNNTEQVVRVALAQGCG